MNYDMVKALHIIAVISWMAGLLYLPRLFVYHASAKTGSELSETLKIMERRLLRIIMHPALVLVWLSGTWLAVQSGAFQNGWMHGKMAAVLILTAAHLYFTVTVRRFATDRNRQTPRFFRILNELPTLAMIAAVFLVVVKP
jgi:putative membrane protein